MPAKIKLTIATILLCVFFVNDHSAQNFTWMKGTNQADQPGSYGTQGTASPSNLPGGRENAASWRDASGNFWIFGGKGFDYIGNYGVLNDLWKYNPNTNQWTWIKGDDIFLQLGAYGTLSVPTSTNKPGAREGASSWVDPSGNLWMFGGYGYGSTASLGRLNDLWKFNTTSLQWTWMSGSDLTDMNPDYGTIGVPSPTNVPGSRNNAASWTDSNGNLWMFGGFGYASNMAGHLNDLWRFNTTTSQWTWMHGTIYANLNGIYGTQGTPATTNMPGGRHSAMTWVDNTGDMWMLGGSGYDISTNPPDVLNDLWKYSAASNQWTSVKGSTLSNQAGTYGSIGVSSASNMPGSRMGGVTWKDGANNLWLFGGNGNASGISGGKLNDLWKYTPSNNQWTWINGIALNNGTGIYGTQGIPSSSNLPGARSYASSWTDASNNLWLFGGNGYSASQAGSLHDMWKYNNCEISPITVVITSNAAILCIGQAALITASGSNNYSWAQGTTGPTISVSPTVNTTYTVYTSGSNGCIYSAAFTQSVQNCVGLSGTAIEHELNIFPNPSKGYFSVRTIRGGTLLIYNICGELVKEKDLMKGENDVFADLAPGVYQYRYTGEETRKTGRLVIEN